MDDIPADAESARVCIRATAQQEEEEEDDDYRRDSTNRDRPYLFGNSRIDKCLPARASLGGEIVTENPDDTSCSVLSFDKHVRIPAGASKYGIYADVCVNPFRGACGRTLRLRRQAGHHS